MWIFVSSFICFFAGALVAFFLIARDKTLVHINLKEDVVIKSKDLDKLMKGYALVAKKINPEIEPEE